MADSSLLINGIIMIYYKSIKLVFDLLHPPLMPYKLLIHIEAFYNLKQLSPLEQCLF